MTGGMERRARADGKHTLTLTYYNHPRLFFLLVRLFFCAIMSFSRLFVPHPPAEPPSSPNAPSVEAMFSQIMDVVLKSASAPPRRAQSWSR
jgi:hypothetical protein